MDDTARTPPPPNPAKSTAKATQSNDQDHEHLDDQEKILAGRYDVNYPALLTKDVAGG